MTAQKGTAFLLKVGDGGAPPAYATVAGLRTTQMSINGETVVVTTRIRAAGANCCRARGCARSRSARRGCSPASAPRRDRGPMRWPGTLDDYELSFESGETLRGQFLVTRLDYAGDFNGERNYTLAAGKLGRGGAGVSAAAECRARRGGDRCGRRQRRAVLRPSFAALVAAEEELGPLFALVERARRATEAGRDGRAVLALPGRAATALTREQLGEAVDGAGPGRSAPALRVLLAQILQGRG